jgi:hypothetical protein
MWLGQEKLQKMIVKARTDMGQAPAKPAIAEAPPPTRPEEMGALPVAPQPQITTSQIRMAGGGAVPAAWPGFAGGNSRTTGVPARTWRTPPYPGGSNTGAVRSAIPGV